MKLAVSFSELDAQYKRIGADHSRWLIGSNTLTPRERLLADLKSGIEIRLEEIKIGPGRLLTYKGEQVLLYIRDTRSSRWTLENEPEKSRRFHVADCRTLERMRDEGRFERYVVTNRTDGRFLADWIDPDTGETGNIEAALKVCKDCLRALNWRGVSQRGVRGHRAGEKILTGNEIWESFEITDFLMEYSTFFSSGPSRNADEAVPDVYVENWPLISRQKRLENDWRCEECGVRLVENSRLLHVHHKSGVKTDNSPMNLVTLCVICHSKQPMHSHLIVTPKDRMVIINARIAQHIDPHK